jgi:radical SAM superfamily enzyme YgiQ (UPF0313 family)
MRILLINPKTNAWSPNIYAPLGLAYVAGALIKNRHITRIIDLNIENLSDKQWRDEIYSADIIGITGMITEYKNVVKLSHFIRGIKKNAVIVLGGTLASLFTDDLLKETKADYAVINEGENTAVQLLNYLQVKNRLMGIKGLAYRDNGIVKQNLPSPVIEDLDFIPFPAHHLLNMERYTRDYLKVFGIKVETKHKLRGVTMIASRGCPYRCVYCSKIIWGNGYRHRSAGNIVQEIKELNNQYGVNEIIFNDDELIANPEMIMEMCELINKSHLEIYWYCNGRINLVNKELLDAMYSAGCRGIAYGLESGNQAILNQMHKGVKLQQEREAIELTKKSGIKVAGYFILGMLGETKKDIETTFQFARELDLDYYGFSTMSPTPDTPIWKEAQEVGKIKGVNKDIKEWSSGVNYNLTADVSDKELMNYERRALKEFYLQKQFGKKYYLSPAFICQGMRYVFSSLKAGKLGKLIARI